MASEADTLSGKREDVPDVDSGAAPYTIFRPKRKRAFHRALKRGELWAVYKKSQDDLMRAIYKSMLFGDSLISTEIWSGRREQTISFPKVNEEK